MVGVAQLVEPQIVDLVVVGSSPIVHPTPPSNEPWERGLPALDEGAPPSFPRLQDMAILHPNRLAFDAIHTGPLAQLGRAVDS